MNAAGSRAPQRGRRAPLVVGVVAVVVVVVAVGLAVRGRGPATLRIEGLPATAQARAVTQEGGGGAARAPSAGAGDELSVTLNWLRPAKRRWQGSAGGPDLQSPPFAWEPVEGRTLSQALWHFRPEDGAPVVEACFDVREAGRPADDWDLAEISVRDAVGRAVEDSLVQHQMVEGGRLYAWLVRPSTDESAWELAASFVRCGGAQFAPDETWTVTGVAVSDEPLTHTRTLQGVTVRLLGVAPAGRVTYSEGRLTKVEQVDLPEQGTSFSGSVDGLLTTADSEPTVVWRVSGWTGDHYISALVTDAEGESLGPVSAEGIHAIPELDVHDHQDFAVRAFRRPAGGGAVTITFHVQRARHAEFVIRPSS